MSIIQLGSISTGTLRMGDLIPTTLDVVESILLENKSNFGDDYTKFMGFIRSWKDSLDPQFKPEGGKDQDLLYAMDGPEIWDEITLFINEFLCPPYVYFGALEGDGADIGFWVACESLEDAVHDGDVKAVQDLCEVPYNWLGPVLLVNDHGNMTLYHHATFGVFSEHWSTV